jgi:deoxycytidine triphosphate deaminase
MVLNGEQIKMRIGIEDRKETNFRVASYDVSIGQIILAGGKMIPARPGEAATFYLPPQGIVEVISREKFRIPETVIGYAMVKTSLGNAGILPLNIGIVDPGYDGYLSSTLLNFSKTPFIIRTGDVFLRMTFHECDASRIGGNQPSLTYQQYLERREEKVLGFSNTFLNLQASIRQITDPIIKKYIWAMISIAIGILALLPFWADYTRLTSVREQIKAELGKEAAEKQSALEERLKILEDKSKLEERIKTLEDQLKARD